MRKTSRRETLAALGVLDSDADADFDRLTRMAAALFQVPISTVSLIDLDRQWFKSSVGIERDTNTPVDLTFCAHTIAEHEHPALIVPDARQDPRFRDNSLVTGPPYIRFYAGAPISVHGERIGTLCVLAQEARGEVDPQLVGQLIELAQLAGSLFELKDEARVRARTAAELIKEEWRHALTLEAGKVGSWVWDLRTGEIVGNDIFRSMFGLDPVGEIHADDMFGAMASEDRAAVHSALDQAFEGGVDYTAEFRVLPERWLIARGRVYQRDGKGKPLIMMGVNIDVTETHQAAAQTRLLLRELNHRVKNTLAIIQSLARQTMRQAPDPARFIDAFSGRLRTLSDAHALLSDRDWSGIGLTELIHSQVDPYLMASPDQLVVSGQDVQLPPDHALGLGLVLHELSSNAVKYGALSLPTGVVDVSWRLEAGPKRRLVLVWKERTGPKVKEPENVGFGTRLISRGLEKVLDSAVDLAYPVDGVEARISFPLSNNGHGSA